MQALKSCQINEWLPSFGNLAYKTEIVQLPGPWANFLTSDGVYVNEGSKAVSWNLIRQDLIYKIRSVLQVAILRRFDNVLHRCPTPSW